MTSRVLVLHPVLLQNRKVHLSVENRVQRSEESCLEEAVSLAKAVDVTVAHAEILQIKKTRPGRLFGQGQIEHCLDIIKEKDIDLIVVNHSLTPVQQRNLETDWDAKVIDRTGLILEIFGARAKTKEGKLQVELASLNFQKSRLVRSWTHLERQRGGFGFTGGPGETQIEIDRRLIGGRITRLKKELEQVRRTRGLQRKSRQKVPYPVVALVGYTNAGKSTLFNKLTQADVMAEDLLFATLDPTMRAVTLPSGRKIILSDTVGFISDLPTDLIAAFRATLEEIEHAAVILHVCDVSQDAADAERQDVLNILQDMDIDVMHDDRLIEVSNKIDLLSEEEQEYHVNKSERQDNIYSISSITGQGIDALLQEIDRFLNRNQDIFELDVEISDGKTIAWFYEHGNVIKRLDDEEFAHMMVGLDARDLSYMQKNMNVKGVKKIDVKDC